MRGYEISTDRARLDRPLIHRFLSEESYWARGRSREVVDRSIERSLCFGAYRGARQVAFARAVTDRATFAWLADVFVVHEERGRGLGLWLVETVLAHPDLEGVGWHLRTADAHGLYSRFGFTRVPGDERLMVRGDAPVGAAVSASARA